MSQEIKNFSNYTITKDGIVYSKLKNKIIKHWIDGYGYPSVSLRGDDKKKHNLKIHRLIALHFIENKYNKPYINHKNCIKTDYSIENLEWCTQSENIIHSFKNNKSKISKLNRSITSKRLSKTVIDISTGIFYSSLKEANKIYNLKYTTLRAMVGGQNKNKTNLRYAK